MAVDVNEDNEKWYRVVDPQSPLYGCDVRGRYVDLNYSDHLSIHAMRRVDVVVGDRPFQMIAPKGKSLGLWIDVGCLEVSPLQDDVIEMSRESPYGEVVSDETWGDAVCLNLTLYGRALQASVTDSGKLIARNTWLGDLEELKGLQQKLIGMYHDEPFGDLVDFIGNGGRA